MILALFGEGYQKPTEEERRERRESVERALSTLTPEQRRIMELRFGLDGHEPRTLRETGEVVGMSSEQVRMIERVASRRLRQLTAEDQPGRPQADSPASKATLSPETRKLRDTHFPGWWTHMHHQGAPEEQKPCFIVRCSSDEEDAIRQAQPPYVRADYVRPEPTTAKP